MGPVDRSVNVTRNGTPPEVGVALNAATGGGRETVIVFVAVAEPPGPVTVKRTVYIAGVV
jgi:hypothetical protein